MLARITLLIAFATSPAMAQESVCFGTTGNGRLENGEQLPASGNNFESYSSIGSLAGRTYVHSKVRAVVVAAYKALETNSPDKTFVYGETGLKAGGRIRPHKTHQNGLSVDFMVPVLKEGRSVSLPSSPFNKFGYEIEFNANGKYEDYTIDFEAMAHHLMELHRAADSHGLKIRRVIFDVPLQKHLFETSLGPELRKLFAFSTKPAWVRHDEHYHVDFEVPCRQLQPA